LKRQNEQKKKSRKTFRAYSDFGSDAKESNCFQSVGTNSKPLGLLEKLTGAFRARSEHKPYIN
jgi:hypothetical protein